MDGFYDDFLKTSGNENILMCVVECTFKHEIYDIFNVFWFLIYFFCQFVSNILNLAIHCKNGTRK